MQNLLRRLRRQFSCSQLVMTSWAFWLLNAGARKTRGRKRCARMTRQLLVPRCALRVFGASTLLDRNVSSSNEHSCVLGSEVQAAPHVRRRKCSCFASLALALLVIGCDSRSFDTPPRQPTPRISVTPEALLTARSKPMTTEPVVTDLSLRVSLSEYPLSIIGYSGRSARLIGDPLKFCGSTDPRAESQKKISRS